MIVFGNGSNAISLGTIETRHCEACGAERSFSLIVHYRYWGLYWIFNCVTHKRYVVLCDGCRSGQEIDRNAVESRIPPVKLPFMHRYGLLLLFGAIAALILFASIFGSPQHR